MLVQQCHVNHPYGFQKNAWNPTIELNSWVNHVNLFWGEHFLADHHTKKVPAGCSYCESLAFFFHLGFWYTRGYWGCNLLRLILGFIICYADRRWCLERNECIELLLALLLGKIVDHLNDDIFRKIIGGCLKMGDTIHTLIKIAIQIEKNWKIHRMIHGVL